MNEKLIESLTNPLKCKLLVSIDSQERVTTKELPDMIEGVPSTTLYRYLEKMLKYGLIKIVEERQIRNVKEKIYGIAIDLSTELERIGNEPSAKASIVRIQQFLNGIVEEFHEYQRNNSKDNSDTIFTGSGTGFLIYPFYATSDEIGEIQKKIAELIGPYLNNNTTDRQLRNMAIVFTLPTTNNINKISKKENKNG